MENNLFNDKSQLEGTSIFRNEAGNLFYNPQLNDLAVSMVAQNFIGNELTIPTLNLDSQTAGSAALLSDYIPPSAIAYNPNHGLFIGNEKISYAAAHIFNYDEENFAGNTINKLTIGNSDFLSATSVGLDSIKISDYATQNPLSAYAVNTFNLDTKSSFLKLSSLGSIAEATEYNSYINPIDIGKITAGFVETEQIDTGLLTFGQPIYFTKEEGMQLTAKFESFEHSVVQRFEEVEQMMKDHHEDTYESFRELVVDNFRQDKQTQEILEKIDELKKKGDRRFYGMLAFNLTKTLATLGIGGIF